MGVTWNGPDLADLANDLRAHVDNAIDAVVEVVHETTAEGVEGMRAALHDAHTPTGEKRVASGAGPYAGRYETGAMHDAIAQSVEMPHLSKVVGKFGWLESTPGHLWDRIRDQEDGTDKIEPMNAFQVWLETVASIDHRMSQRGFTAK